MILAPLALALAVLTPAPQCQIDSPEEFKRGSQEFCDSGIFSGITIKADKEELTFDATLELNYDGYRQFMIPEGRENLYNRFAGIVAQFYMKYKVVATVKFYYNGGAVGRCFPNIEKQHVQCGPQLEGLLVEG